MRLYAFPASPNCLKVRAVAYELGVELDVTEVNILRGESRSAAFEQLNPNRLVPVLVDGSFVLWESNAIITYLASTHRTPVLLSADPRERADTDRWLHWQSAHLSPAVSKVAFEGFVKPMTSHAPIDRVAAVHAVDEFRAHCRALEASLGDKPYLATGLSVADFAVACILNSACMAGLSVDAFPRTRVWLQQILARDSLKRALSDAQLAGQRGALDLRSSMR
jgi:glutathione S-transferase